MGPSHADIAGEGPTTVPEPGRCRRGRGARCRHRHGDGCPSGPRTSRLRRLHDLPEHSPAAGVPQRPVAEVGVRLAPSSLGGSDSSRVKSRPDVALADSLRFWANICRQSAGNPPILDLNRQRDRTPTNHRTPRAQPSLIHRADVRQPPIHWTRGCRQARRVRRLLLGKHPHEEALARPDRVDLHICSGA